MSCRVESELRAYLESEARNEIDSQLCPVCNEYKHYTEFDFSKVCVECESDGAYVADGMFEDAGGHIINI